VDGLGGSKGQADQEQRGEEEAHGSLVDLKLR